MEFTYLSTSNFLAFLPNLFLRARLLCEIFAIFRVAVLNERIKRTNKELKG